MQLVDWLVVLLYLLGTLALGLYLSPKGSQSLTDFFVSGRSLPWWLAGTSMAATTFSIDTPLIITSIVATRGIAGNWVWWSFGIAHILMIYLFARLWRRSEVITDAELTELRYGGYLASWLRGVKAFLFAVPINCLGIGYAMLAMVKVVDALQLWQSLGFNPEENQKICSVVGVSIFVLTYAGFSGLWGVVATDFFQFFLGLTGAIIVAIIALQHMGGIHELIPQVEAVSQFNVLTFFPLEETAKISLTTFGSYLFLQWWSFRRSDGGGEFIQRLLSVKDETEAVKSAWLFNILHYIVRTWPWIVVALVAIVYYPNLEDPELAYPKLMLEFLPPILLGLVVASLIAAFMSTVSTSINWGASYLTNDLYQRFVNPEATQPQLVLVGRLSSIFVTVIGAIAAFYADDIYTVFELVIAIGTGPGLILILRWFWWRINAATELAAMLSGLLMGVITSLVPAFGEVFADFGLRLLVISVVTITICFTVMLLTPPESENTLDEFYRRVRPDARGWRRQQQRTQVIPLQDLGQDLQKAIAAIFILYGLMFAVGGFLLLQPLTGWIALIFAVGGGLWLRTATQISKRSLQSRS
ncbi:MAG: sodium:proline symporter [Gloeocapsa sp. DLM2.Bin57]|nr:MAG: sodium:proline symporter [Gloeocapsa sp. DLM2.Bin57]